jgi:hypothetical protein
LREALLLAMAMVLLIVALLAAKREVVNPKKTNGRILSTNSTIYFAKSTKNFVSANALSAATKNFLKISM